MDIKFYLNSTEQRKSIYRSIFYFTDYRYRRIFLRTFSISAFLWELIRSPETNAQFVFTMLQN